MKKQVLVTADRGETRVAILEAEGTLSAEDGKPKGDGRGGRPPQQKKDDWKVAELYVERRGSRSIVGNIYKGRVDNVLPGLEAAFVDIGLDKNGFLHADDSSLRASRSRAAAAAAARAARSATCSSRARRSSSRRSRTR